MIQHPLFRAGYQRASALPCHHHTRTSFRPHSLPLCLLCCNQVGWLFAIKCYDVCCQTNPGGDRSGDVSAKERKRKRLTSDVTKPIRSGGEETEPWNNPGRKNLKSLISIWIHILNPTFIFQPWRTNSNSVINRFLRIDINIELYQYIATMDLMRYYGTPITSKLYLFLADFHYP